MKPKFDFYEWLTTHFLVNIRNIEDFSLKRSYRLNYAKIILGILLFTLVVSSSSIYIYKRIDSYYSDEYKKERQLRRRIVMLNLAIDSLETEMAQKDTFIHRIKKVMLGENPVIMQPVAAAAKNPASNSGNYAKNVQKMSEAERQLRTELQSTSPVINNGKAVANAVMPITNKSKLSDFFFFPPLTGLVNNPFDATTKHFGIDIIAKENEPIVTIADGSVIYSGWSYDTGYMLVIQHEQDLISVYKHNSSLLKKMGDYVKSGEVIAIIGNSGEITTGPHLHFELWYKGQPLNPLEYIVF